MAVETVAGTTIVQRFSKGLQGVDKDIFFSLPCIVNTNGVRGIMLQQLDDDEKEKLFVSAKKMEELLQSIEW
ncbi:L-lactate dehydrogenase [Clonorchis sinensis]|uniref:L-lactate dehydrogenase n=1 Tax=Clonorchis sinensis TaxID=79923 RepID=G7Y4B6_CLOSI|nr:L-lactate dehydrogenase [Clonorchis sinensis]